MSRACEKVKLYRLYPGEHESSLLNWLCRWQKRTLVLAPCREGRRNHCKPPRIHKRNRWGSVLVVVLVTGPNLTRRTFLIAPFTGSIPILKLGAAKWVHKFCLRKVADSFLSVPTVVTNNSTIGSVLPYIITTPCPYFQPFVRINITQWLPCGTFESNSVPASTY